MKYKIQIVVAKIIIFIVGIHIGFGKEIGSLSDTIYKTNNPPVLPEDIQYDVLYDIWTNLRFVKQGRNNPKEKEIFENVIFESFFFDFYIQKCKLKSFSSPKRLCVKCGGLVVPHVDCILHDPAHCQHNKGLAVAGKIGLCLLLCILRGQGKAGLSGLGAMQPTEQPK